MELLAALFVSKPLNILGIAAILLILYIVLQFSTRRKGKPSKPILFAASAWVLYAAWEWYVIVKSPEADIRVDLLLIWPILGLLMIWAIFKLFR